MNRVVSVWKPTLPDAHEFIRRHGLEMYFVQFLQDGAKNHGYWVVLNILGTVYHAVKAIDRNLTVIE